MTKLKASELILNSNGSVYHLGLLPHQIADTIITVGDPERVPQISKHFDKIEFKVAKREFITHSGEINGKRATVISTGMGTGNIDIFINELDALANIDLEKRKIKTKKKSLKIVRVGTSGALQKDIKINSFVASKSAVGLDSLLHFYKSKGSNNITKSIKKNLKLSFEPYLFYGDSDLLKLFNDKKITEGNTLTCPGFYAPQGRVLRAENYNSDFINTLENFKNNNFRFTNFEMETAAYYGLCNILNHRVISLSAILANRITGEFSKNPKKVVEELIEFTLRRMFY